MERLQRGVAPHLLETESREEGVVGEIGVPRDLAGTAVGRTDFQARFGLSILMVRPSDGGWVPSSEVIRLGAEDRLIVFGPRARIDALRPGVALPKAPNP
jgi:uncharacterized protein with PhoU and TrkA domain